MIKKEGVMAVGQASEVTGVLTLARQLRPDAVVIDPGLPHVIGLAGFATLLSGIVGRRIASRRSKGIKVTRRVNFHGGKEN